MYTVTEQEQKMINECRAGCSYERLGEMFVDVALPVLQPKKLIQNQIPDEVRRFWNYKNSDQWKNTSEKAHEGQLTDMWKKWGVFYEEKHALEMHNKAIFDKIVYMLSDIKDPIRVEKAMSKLIEIKLVINSIPNSTVFVDMSILGEPIEQKYDFTTPMEWDD